MKISPEKVSRSMILRLVQYPLSNNVEIGYIAFIRILAAVTINFSLAGVWLLIKGDSYSRAAFINLERHLLVTLTQ